MPSARFMTAGHLRYHALRWHKLGKDGSGKCDAFETGVASDIVWGGIFEIAKNEKYLLDKAEGLGVGYSEKLEDIFCQQQIEDVQTVSSTNYSTVQASLYVAIPIEPRAKPYSWYKQFVVGGAIQCGLPASYVSALAAAEDLVDPDEVRSAKNLAILHCETDS